MSRFPDEPGRPTDGFQSVPRGKWRLTRPGRWLLLLTVVFWLAGFYGDRNAFLVVAAVMAPLLVLSVPLSRAVFNGLDVRMRVPRRVQAARPFRVSVDAAKRGGWVGAHGVRIAPGWLRGKHLLLVSLPPGDRLTLTGHFQIQRRGIYELEWLRVSTLFPFGLVRRTAFMPLNREVIVHPPYYLLDTNLFAADPTRLRGIGVETMKPGDDEFYGLREYRPGDRLRKVYWRRSARIGKLVVKEQRAHAEGEMDIILHGDVKLSRMLPVLVERAVNIAAALVNRARLDGTRVRLEVRGRRPGTVLVDAQRGSFVRAMDLLAGFGPGASRRRSGPRLLSRQPLRRVHVIPGGGAPDEVRRQETVVDVADPSYFRWLRTKVKMK